MAFYIGALVIGLLAVAFLAFKGRDPAALDDEPDEDDEIEEDVPGLLNRLGIQQVPGQAAVKTAGPAPQKPPAPSAPLPEGQKAGPPLPKMPGGIEPDLSEKYKRLEALFEEKSRELEKKETALENEIKNRKDFNKVKDALEKELKDRKDHIHKLDLELTEHKTEIEGHKKRAPQLEEKIKKLEDNLKAASAAKPEAPKTEPAKPEAPKPEAPTPEAPKPETPKPEAPKQESPKPEAPKTEPPKQEVSEGPKPENEQKEKEQEE
jgi:hypothetical protein